MNTTEILNKSLAWLNYKGKASTVNSWEVTNILTLADSNSQKQYMGFGVTENNIFIDGFGNIVKPVSDAVFMPVDVQQTVPQEVFILTQVILNTLNTEPEKFHDMSEIPGLESRDWNQLGEVARYLIKQGWIEAKATVSGFQIKLTMQGKLYLGNNDAWA